MYTIDFSGQVALVTGAADGIGYAIAKILTESGAQVIVNDIMQKDRAEEKISDLQEFGKRPYYIQCDISNEESVKAMIEEIVENFGRLDMVVNNAGINSSFEKSFNVNTMGTYYVTNHAMPELIKVKGRVVVITSASVFTGGTGFYPYNATKAGSYALAMMFARNYAKYEVRVNSIAPAVVMSRMMLERFGSEEAIFEHYKTVMPMGHIGYPEDIAGVALFLLSPLSKQMTGELLTVDGGRMHIG